MFITEKALTVIMMILRMLKICFYLSKQENDRGTVKSYAQIRLQTLAE